MGVDSLTHHVIVVTMPPPPTLSLAYATHDALNLTIVPTGDGGAPILGEPGRGLLLLLCARALVRISTVASANTAISATATAFCCCYCYISAITMNTTTITFLYNGLLNYTKNPMEEAV